MLIIPAIDIIEGTCVRLKKGDYSTKKTYSKNPLKVAKNFEDKGAEMLHIVDLDGAKTGSMKNVETILKIRRNVRIPIQVGGGIRNMFDARKYLNNGIDRIILGTKAVENKTLLKNLIKEFGSKRIIVSIDVLNGKIRTKGWRGKTGINYLDFAKELKKTGITEIICTDISRDGTLTSPNLIPLKKLKELGFNIIAAGGISDTKSIEELRKINISGAIIGKALYENKIRIDDFFKNSLAKRIIVCMDIKNGRVVKGKNYKNLEDAGDPVKLAGKYCKTGADELIFLDITATIEKRKILYRLVEQIAENINIPFTVGGGIKTLKDIKELLRRGADKVSIGSAAVANPKLIRRAAKKFGSQCIVISIDPKKNGNSQEIRTESGSKKTKITALEFAKKMEKFGAGELLVNSIDRDGTGKGYDIELLREIGESVRIPIIASSGAGKKEDFLEAFEDGKADAALSASMFHYGKIKIPELKKYLQNNNVKIRP